MIGLYDLFSANARRTPSKPAIVGDGRAFTYRQFDEEIARLARALRRGGVGKGDAVGLLFRNDGVLVALVYALQRIGAEAVLLNFRFGGDDLRRYIEIAECDYLVFADEFLADARRAAAASARSGRVGLISRTVEDRDVASLEALAGLAGRQDDEQAVCDGGDVALVFFTGGTTGFPKAAMHSRDGLTLQVLETLMDPGSWRADDVFLNYAPLYHVGGLLFVLAALSAGATMVLASRFDAESLLRAAAEHGATQTLLIPPSIVERFLEFDEEGRRALSNMRLVTVAGGELNIETAKKIFRLMPNVTIAKSYGMTELAATFRTRFTREEFARNPRIALSVGSPSLFSEVSLCDGRGNEVGVGEVGELYGKSRYMMIGYRGVENPFTPEGWLDTGDLMRRGPDGLYYFECRQKDMIKSGGENVYAIEVEDALLAHPAIAECAVVGVPDAMLGECVAAAVVLRAGAPASGAEELAEFCAARIARYKKPRSVVFLDALPKSSIGKVRKDVLREMLSERLSRAAC